MTTPFDAASKDLVELGPADWLAHLGQPRPPELVRVIDADLSGTVSTATDKVIRVDDPEPWLALIELQASWDGDLPFDLLRRYALLRHRHRLPVSCAIVLLRPEANTSAMTGTFAQPDPLGVNWAFPFRVLRVWEEPAETYLRGPLALLPFAPIAAVDPDGMRPVLSEMKARLDREATRGQGERLRAATFQLLALRYDERFIADLEEYMATLDITQTPLVKHIEARAAEAARLAQAREDLLRLGRKKFAVPAPTDMEAHLAAITDLDRLNSLTDRLLDVSSWQELLAQ